MTNFLLTGIPRSGTSFLANRLNQLDNVYSMNETFVTYPMSLGKNLNLTRKYIKKGFAVPNKYKKKGGLNDNTMLEEEEILFKKVKKMQNPIVGCNGNTPYLLYLQHHYDSEGIDKFIFLVRNPYYTLASWIRHPTLGVNQVLPDNLYEKFMGIPLVGETIEERQAELWNYFAGNIWKYRDKSLIVKYEDLVKNPNKIMKRIAKHFGTTFNGKIKVKNFNKEERYRVYADFKNIRAALKKYCPNRKLYGYKLPTKS